MQAMSYYSVYFFSSSESYFLSQALGATTGNETAGVSPFANFKKTADVSLEITGATHIGKMGASRVFDAHASASFTGTGLTANVVAIEITIIVPANQTAVTKLPGPSGNAFHRNGRNQQNNRQDERNLHPVSINQTKS